MGYLGNKPADSYLTLEKQTFTTSATDTYTLDREVSSVNDIELFLNNVRQEPTTAYTISGTTLTLASAITSSDSLYCIYQGRAVGTQSPASGSVTNDMIAYPLAESGATVSTFNRTSSTGDIIELQKDGTTIGQLAVNFTDNFCISGNSNHAGLNFGTASVVPYKNSSNLDATIDWGSGTTRFKDLYLSGSVYLGGTGSANALDDYEEGTFTVGNAGDSTGVIGDETGEYTKIGRMVYVRIVFRVTTNFSSYAISGLPYTVNVDNSISSWTPMITLTESDNDQQIIPKFAAGTTQIYFDKNNDNNNRHYPNTTNNLYRLSSWYITNA